MRGHKTLGVLAGAIVLFAAARVKAEPAAAGYDVKGAYYETCACAVSCPCASNATLPTEGHCDAISLVHIDKGTSGGVAMDGLSIAVVFRSPKGKKVMDSFKAGDMDLFTIYLDDKATAKQKEAMPGLLGSLFGNAEVKGAKPPQWVPMTFSAAGDVAKFQIAGGSKLSFEIEDVVVGEQTKDGAKKADLGNRIVLTNTAPFPWVHDVSQGISRHFKYADLGTSWEYKERNAFFGTVTAAGK